MRQMRQKKIWLGDGITQMGTYPDDDVNLHLKTLLFICYYSHIDWVALVRIPPRTF